MFHPFRRTSHFESRRAAEPVKHYDKPSSLNGDEENNMPNVANELAALRAKGSVRNLSTELSASGGAALSTPEAEAAALKAKRDNEKLGNIKAKEILNKGSNSAAQTSAEAEHAAKYTANKKADMANKAEATKLLNRGSIAGTLSQEMEHSLSQTGRKRADWEKKVETQRAMASTSGSTPKSSPTNKEDAPQPATEDKNRSEPAAAAAVQTTEASAPIPKEEPVAVEVDDNDVPDLEEADAIPELETPTTDNAPQQKEQLEGASAEEEEGERQIINRNEKKARKMMTRLGMRPVPNIARATLKAGGGRGYFFIDRPDVFVSVGGKSETYVMFGEAKQGGHGGFGGGAAAGGGDATQAARAQAAMAQQRAAMAAQASKGTAVPGVQDEEDVPELVVEEGGGVEDGVEAKDIDLVMGQASCTRVEAVAALRENDGDLVNAIMSLTT